MFRFLFMPCLFAAIVSACSASNPNVDAGRDAGATGDLGPGNADVSAFDTGLLHAPMVVQGRVLIDEMTLVPGATVDVVGASPLVSTVTDADANWTLTLPANDYSLLRSTKDTFRTTQEYVTVPAVPPTIDLRLVPDDQVTGIFAALHVAESIMAGILIMHFRPASDAAQLPGFGATLSVSGGTSFILVGGTMPMLGTVTPASDNTLGFINVPAGMVTVTPIPVQNLTCVSRSGAVTARIDPQVMTILDFDCS